MSPPRKSWHRSPHRSPPTDHRSIPDARDGLTVLERAILVQLARLQAERGGNSVPTAMLYGRVVEHVDVGIEEFQDVLTRLVRR